MDVVAHPRPHLLARGWHRAVLLDHLDSLASASHLLLLPGLDGTGDLFTPLRKHLPPNLQVHGVRYSPDSMQDPNALLAQILEVIPPGTPHFVVAESFSGPLAIRYAAQRSADVKGLILAATYLRNPLVWYLRWLPHLANRWCFSRLSSKLAARGFLLNARAKASDIEAVQNAMHKVSPKVLAHRVRGLPRLDVTEEFTRLKMPMLYLLAKQDRLIGRRGLRQMQEHRPDLSVCALDSPHLILQDQPQACVAAIEAMRTDKLP
mgnify:CR=1 FL=1